MDNLNVIDNFMQTFIRYIDSGFGLLQGDVAALTTVLVGIDITLAGLFWAMDGEANILARLIKKVLYVGTFAFIMNNFSTLAMIIFNSFSTLGLQATDSRLTAQTCLRPGKLAGTGYQAAWPLLQQAGSLIGFTTFFNNFVTIVVLLFAWFVVILAFFILAVQLFITIIEFKLTTLAGFVLVPFALWNKTAFLAERVLGNVVIVRHQGDGPGRHRRHRHDAFSASSSAPFKARRRASPTRCRWCSRRSRYSDLAFSVPASPTGLVSGAPQLGAGAAIGTAGALVGGGALAGGGAVGAARLAAGAGIGAIRAGTALTAGASTAYEMAQATSGASGAAASAPALPA